MRRRQIDWFGVLAAGVLVTVCAQAPGQEVMTGQGLLAGEVTESSVILQTRLTLAESVLDGDVPGTRGVACFELATNELFRAATRTEWLNARAENDFIVKIKITGLQPGTLYYYRAWVGRHPKLAQTDVARAFKTLPGAESDAPVKFVVGGAMNYRALQQEIAALPMQGNARADLSMGYPALRTLYRVRPDFYVAAGNSVFYDEPATEESMRRQWHVQFVLPRVTQFFSIVPAYWMRALEFGSSRREEAHSNSGEEGQSLLTSAATDWSVIATRLFREQLPVTDPSATNAVTYRTHRVSRHLQLWLLDAWNHRESKKTLWGGAQREWLQRTLKESDAAFKVVVSPEPLIGVGGEEDKAHRQEREEFFTWLKENAIVPERVLFLSGGLPWQQQVAHALGYEELTCGPLHAEIAAPPAVSVAAKRLYASGRVQGGYLEITCRASELRAVFCDELGKVMREVVRSGVQ
ncbi:MAG: PhoD-like phosphatase N-terminal domain-containing protein [Verrucomicrobiota bacterium]